LVESLTKQPSVVADYVVIPRTISGGPPEDVFPNLLLRDLAGPVQQVLFADVEKEITQKA
jgi:hypothetical protein